MRNNGTGSRTRQQGIKRNTSEAWRRTNKERQSGKYIGRTEGYRDRGGQGQGEKITMAGGCGGKRARCSTGMEREGWAAGQRRVQ